MSSEAILPSIDVQEISITLIEEHPENSNVMDSKTRAKLRAHIRRTGRYEPLTVRLHPTVQGKFQVLNGHNRLRTLRGLGYSKARCIVWNVDDNQARLYLATLNRLSGKDAPERRAILLERLLSGPDSETLQSLLPEDEKQIEQLQQLLQADFVAPNRVLGEINENVLMTFTVAQEEAREIDLALELILRKSPNALSRSAALVRLAQSYLSNEI